MFKDMTMFRYNNVLLENIIVALATIIIPGPIYKTIYLNIN